MSLKIFHICFIIISTLLCAGVAWWCFANGIEKMVSYSFVAAAVVLPVYGAWFLKKTRNFIL